MFRTIRRAIVALALGALGAVVFRVRGRGGVPSQHGGWREVSPKR